MKQTSLPEARGNRQEMELHRARAEAVRAAKRRRWVHAEDAD